MKTTDITYIVNKVPPMGQTSNVFAALGVSETVYNSVGKSREKG
jgi:hypothetical protein